MDKIVATLLGVVLAVGASSGLWVGTNLVFDQTTRNWRRFSGLIGAIIGFVLFAILSGNRLLQILGPRDQVADGIHDAANAVPAITTALIFAVLGWLLGAALGAYTGRTRLDIAGAVVGAVLGAVIGAVAVQRIPVDTIITFLWWPLIGAALLGLVGIVLSATEDRLRRLAIGVAGGLAVGLLIGFTLMSLYEPALRAVPLLAWPLAAAGAGAAINAARRRNPLTGALVLGAVGWMVGAWGVPALGPGTRAEAIMATTVPAVLLGARVGLWRNPAWHERTAIDQRSRSWIFLTPALAFIGVTLVIPTIRTMYLSLLDRSSQEWVGFENFRTIFTSPSSFDISGWSNIFTSQLFFWAVGLAVVALVVAVIQGRRYGTGVDISGPALSPMAVAALLLAFAVFTSLRGTIINNLWWVFTVTLLATSFGLLIAVLADRAGAESVAKSLIFMPMAISFVGASIIWRFMYLPRDVSRDQTGVLNALWVALGQVSNSSARWVFAALFAALALAVLWWAAKAVGRGDVPQGIVTALVAIPPLWLAYRFAGPGLGGFTTSPDGTTSPQTVLFIQEPPWNNVWLMVVLIWIQTGFAMVILSAAIKAVPGEFIEAAQMDGATENQIFWRIVIPSIAPTIGVVVTTLIVTVMKVFDIVKVMTNGNFDTQVIANEMFNEAFQRTNNGLGAALAVVLFLSVLPVMFVNVRRMQNAQ